MPVMRGRSGSSANDAGSKTRQSRRELTAEIEEETILGEGCMTADSIAGRLSLPGCIGLRSKSRRSDTSGPPGRTNASVTTRATSLAGIGHEVIRTARYLIGVNAAC